MELVLLLVRVVPKAYILLVLFVTEHRAAFDITKERKCKFEEEVELFSEKVTNILDEKNGIFGVPKTLRALMWYTGRIIER